MSGEKATTFSVCDVVSEMEKLCQEEHYSMVAMLTMNPVEKKGEEIIVKGNKRIVEKAFGVTMENDKCFIPTIMSRKKDFIPRIGRFPHELISYRYLGQMD